jgi:NAD(P)-dependent dehydrogenase (short-subunit alcohol dehydrogenase family)
MTGMSFRLDGKVALVTGGGRGIGKAIARRFADAGANVVIASRKLENLESTAKECEGLAGKVIPIACHVGKPDQLRMLVSETEKRTGTIDILVNNSATNIGQGPALDVTDDALLKTFEVNVLAAHRLIRLVVPKMAAGGKGGSIINIASIAGLRGYWPGFPSLAAHYAASKMGVVGFTRQAAAEYAREKIRVNAIAPGWHSGTDLIAARRASTPPEAIERFETEVRRRIPMGRRGTPDDLAGLVVYLASDASSYLTGQVISHDGGWDAAVA